MKAPTGLFGSSVYSKTSTKLTDPALIHKVGPPVIENYSNRPSLVVVIVTVPPSITAGDVCFIGPAPVSVVDLPLSAVKTPKKVPLMKYVPLPVSRKTDVP